MIPLRDNIPSDNFPVITVAIIAINVFVFLFLQGPSFSLSAGDNVETVPRLYPVARRGSKFLRSARVLKMAKEMGGERVVTKSGLMVGLGESFEEMIEAFGILREHRVQVLTVGQYLRPTENHLPVVRYWHPEEFEALEKAAYELGFESVASGPLVRSSYHADQNLPERALAG